MKKIYLFFLLIFSFMLTMAQTWTGAVGKDWNDASNWNPAGVPGSTSNIIIPGSVASTNWPKFTANVVINSIEMQPGCLLDVNGYSLTILGVNMNNNFNQASIINNNFATDIVMNINTGTGGYLTYFRSNTVNDNIIFNLTGSNQFIEGVAAPLSVYYGDVVFNINDVLPTSISYGVPSYFFGNLAVNRTVAGATSLFYAGADLSGDFTYLDNTGSPAVMGNPGYKTSIAGKINITANFSTPAVFEMYRLVNQSNGGNIYVTNSLGFNLQLDTLLVSSLNISGYRGNDYGRLFNNKITGNITIADDVSYTGGFATYIRNNTITGNCSFFVNGSNVFYEADIAGSGNNYIGNVDFNSTGASLYIGHGAPLQCSGDVSINRTGSGLTTAFNTGAVIDGNLNYSNYTSGNTYFGNMNIKTIVAGTVNISALHTAKSIFEIYHLVNQTNGGSINIQNSLGFNFQKDTLLLNSITIGGYGGNEYGRMLNNSITAMTTLNSDQAYSTGFATYIRNNIFTGNTLFQTNGINAFYEADIAGSGNKYYGNLSVIIGGTGDVFIAHLDSLWCSGDVMINRATSGNTWAFNAGTTINGNFSYSNNTAAGYTALGNVNYKTNIEGTLNVYAAYVVPGNFIMYRLINKLNGGNITVQNSLGFDIVNNTLLLGLMSIEGYRGNAHGRLLNNDITATVNINPYSGYSSGFATYIRNNTITGNCTFNVDGSNTFFESDIAGSVNKYFGNLDVNIAGTGDVYIAHLDSSWWSGNLTLNRYTAGNTVAFNAGATINGNFSFTNNTTGYTSFGNLNNKTSIEGTINVYAVYFVPAIFAMQRLINKLNGGSIIIQNTQGFEILNDTLLVTSMNVEGYRGNAYGRFLNNSITGNVTLADDASYAGGWYTYIRNNVITGNSYFSNNGSNAILDADIAGSGNKYLGDLTYVRTAGSIVAAANDYNEVSGNLILSSTSNISLGKFRFTGNTNGIVEQASTQPISMTEITIQKNTGATITLFDPVTVINNVSFTSGRIISNTGSELIFADNSNHTGSSDISHVNGPVIKTGNDTFTFPIGKINKLASINISAPLIGTDEFRAEYFWMIPHNSGFDSTLKDPTIHHVSDNEYWMLDRTAGTSNVTVNLSWETSRSGVVDHMPDMRVARWNGSIWKDEGNGGTTGNNAAGSVITSGAVNSFSPFTLASASALNPIPVKLLNFTVIKDNGKAKLQWISGNETNFSGYEIERGTDGTRFSKLSSVAAKGGAIKNTYEVYDEFPLPGINYYRLKMIDRDYKYSYSIILRADFGKNTDMIVYPNPARDYFVISNAGPVSHVQIIDNSGRLIRKWDKTTSTRYNISGLNKGVYFLRITVNGETIISRLIVE